MKRRKIRFIKKISILIIFFCMMNIVGFCADFSDQNTDNFEQVNGNESSDLSSSQKSIFRLGIHNKKSKSEKHFEKERKLEENKRLKASKKRVVGKKRQNGNVESKLDIQSTNMEFFEDRQELEATGDVKVYFPEENMSLFADKIVFNYQENSITAIDNVRILKNKSWVFGDYIVVDLGLGSSLISEPITKDDRITLKAQYGNVTEDKLKAYFGDIKLSDKIGLRIESQAFGRYFPLEREFAEKFYFSKKMSSPNFKLKAKKVILDRDIEHDKVELRSADVYYKDLRIGSVGHLNLFSDKDQSYAEINGPSLGSMSQLGMYLGYGHVFKIPMGSTLKLTPILLLDKDFGVGVIGRFSNRLNRTEFAYGTVKGKLLARGKQNISDNWDLNYAINQYSDEWFLGARRPQYIAELAHKKTYTLESDIRFENRFTAGFAKDYYTDMSTLRTRWQTQTSKDFVRYRNDDMDLDIKLGLMGQTSLALYGTGDSQGIVRAGPTLFTRYRGWTQKINYLVAGTAGDSPMDFDRYRYGKSAIEFIESLALCKYLSVSYSGTAILAGTKYNDKLFQENRFYISVGPENAKLSFGYDMNRSNSYFDFAMLVGTEGNMIDFEELEVKNPKNGSRSKNKKLIKGPSNGSSSL